MKGDHPGVDLLADLTQRPREELAGDYAAMGRALREHLGSLGRAALDSVSGKPERMAEAQERMAAWNETLKSHGVGAEIADGADAPAPPHAAADPRATSVQPAAFGNRPGAGEGAPESRTAAPDIASQLRAMADAMRRRADALAAARDAARGESDAQSPDPSNESDVPRNNPTGDHTNRP